MSGTFAPKLEILPASQRELWPELRATPAHFTLYGGTAIALRLGHRASVDFDFFSQVPFDPAHLANEVPYLAGATLRASAANTLTMTVERSGPVQLSFFGGMRKLGQIAASQVVDGPQLSVASLVDLAGTKVAVVARRAEPKDYLDIHALLTRGGLALPMMLAAAATMYGPSFSPVVALKAISYHDEPSLGVLPESVRRDLIAAVRDVDVEKLPKISFLRRWED